jgi:hypothetical protein
MLELVAAAQPSTEALPSTRVCQALVLSRATYDRWRVAGPALARDVELRAQIQEIALEMPAYGRTSTVLTP